MESMYGMRGVVKVISIRLNCMCVHVCVVSGEFSLVGKYVWDAGCSKSDQHQFEVHVCVCVCLW